MTSSSRISFILLGFFLLPTVVFSTRCFQGDSSDPSKPPRIRDCSPLKRKCWKMIARPPFAAGVVQKKYGCEFDTVPNGWSVRNDSGVEYDVYVCDKDDCNTFQVVVPSTTTTSTTTTTAAPTTTSGPVNTTSSATTAAPTSTTSEATTTSPATTTRPSTTAAPLNTTSPAATISPDTTPGFESIEKPSSSSQATGVSWICLCLMGLMTSWLLVIN